MSQNVRIKSKEEDPDLYAEHLKIIDLLIDFFKLNNISPSRGSTAMANLIVNTFLRYDEEAAFLLLLDHMKKCYYKNK